MQVIPPEKSEAMKREAWGKLKPGTLFRTQTQGTYSLPKVYYIVVDTPKGNVLPVIALNPSNRQRLILGQEPEKTSVTYETLRLIDIKEDVEF